MVLYYITQISENCQVFFCRSGFFCIFAGETLTAFCSGAPARRSHRCDLRHIQKSAETIRNNNFPYRPPRGTEQNGVEYFFLTPEEFKQRIANNEFLEYEEVYTDRFYGTLKAQVEKQLEAGQNVIFDVDVVGGCNIKKFYGERALSVFIQPPSVEELRKRLNGRGTDAPEVIESRIAKAEFELSYADKFDVVIINDDLDTAKADALKVISDFLKK